MEPAETLRLLGALAEARERHAAAARLAERLGCDALYVFVPHPDSPARLFPAPGFPQTLPSSRGWRELLAACEQPGRHRGEVAYPTGDRTAPAIGHAFPGIAFVLVGAAAEPEDQAELDAPMMAAAPLLAALLRAEADVIGARGELELARQSEERASALTRALDLARGEAERATRVKDELLAMIGHELRNPLAPIVTALQMMRLGGIHSRAQDLIERQVAHIMRLIDDLLDISRITRGKIELRVETLEVATAIRRAIEIARPLLEERRSEIALEVPEQGLLVTADPARLAQVVSNLLTNAAKYSDAGTTIRVRAERNGARVSISVEDQGIGIAPAVLGRVFEQFMQVPQGLERSVGGLGLGLAIVRNLVAMHGGTVHAFSDGIGRGSRFVVELPLAPTPAVPPQSEPPSPVAATPSGGASVLVVDDNRDAAELFGEVLAVYGYQVRIAHSGPEALAVLDDFAPDAALLDIGLPVMDGYELARHLRTRLDRIQLVALTGYGQPGDRERAIEAGFDAHLVKPVTVASVRETLARLLR